MKEGKKTGYFRAVVESGHIGAGNYREMVVYLRSSDMLTALGKVRLSPGLKHKDTSRGIKTVEAVSRKKFCCKLSGPDTFFKRLSRCEKLWYFHVEPPCTCKDRKACEI